MIHATSRNSAAALADQTAALLSDPAGAAADRLQVADELYSLSQLLISQPRLRRSLGDATTDASSRADLGRRLLTGKISPISVDIAAAAFGQRWSSPWDLVDVLEISGDDVLLSVAEQQGLLDDVEADLFRFERILQNSSELTAALDDAIAAPSRRVELVDSLLSGKVEAVSLTLIRHAVSSTRRRRLQSSLDDLLEASASRRDRSVARVITATELTEEQSRRLSSVLSRIYHREISIRAAVDPTIRGGLMVRVGDEVIDGTVSGRMAAARAALSI